MDGMEKTGPQGDVPGESQGFSSVPGFESKGEQKSGEHGRHPQWEEWGRCRGWTAERSRRMVWNCERLARCAPDVLERLESVSGKYRKNSANGKTRP